MVAQVARKNQFGLLELINPSNPSNPISIFQNSPITIDLDLMIDSLNDEIDNISNEKYYQALLAIKAYFASEQKVRVFSDSVPAYLDRVGYERFEWFINFCFFSLSPILNEELTVKGTVDVFEVPAYSNKFLIVKPDNGSEAILLVWAE
jgi:hypothetical protein